MRSPNFFIVGAPKCGTTAMAQYLAKHPQVFMSDPKEPHHFSDDLNHGNFSNPDAYARLFSGAAEQHKIVGEASVWYLYSEVAVPRIAAEIPDARFLVMLRNPVEMAPSLHQQLYFSGTESHRSFETAWRAQKARRAGNDIPYFAGEPKKLLYKEACSLGAQLSRLYQHVPRERVLCVFHDDFRSAPRDVWIRVQGFLGLDDDGRTDFPSVNAAKQPRLVLFNRLTSTYAKLRRRIGFGPGGTGLLVRLRGWNTRPRERAGLSTDLRGELQQAFAEDIECVEMLEQRDLSAWKGDAREHSSS